ncbi:MAG: hypothetical protein HY655_11830 [Acidobacteria bacterium]|nr:hypothetical protein [Acidobacteriota bacterium]
MVGYPVCPPGLPNGLNQPRGNGGGRLTGVGDSIGFIDPESRLTDNQFSESNFFAGGSSLMNNYDVDVFNLTTIVELPFGPGRRCAARTSRSAIPHSGRSGRQPASPGCCSSAPRWPGRRYDRGVGLTHIKARIANPARPAKSSTVTFLVDSGAVYSVVPAATLRRLGIRSHSSRTFLLADGSEITRRVGDALFFIDGRRAASPVIFGEKDDSPLLGAVSLESLGLILDPMKRVLRPLPMVLGQLRGPR